MKHAAVVSLAVCQLATVAHADPLLLPPRFAQIPAEEPVLATTSYRHATLAVDGISLGLFLVGGLAEGPHGEDTDLSEGLMMSGMIGGTFGTPVVHLMRGHGGRFLASLGMRVGLTSLGMLAAVSANRGCDDPSNDGEAILDPDFLCELDYVGYGYVAGLAAAMILDAAFLTDETREVPRWSPQLAASRDGARVGVAWTW